MRVVLKCASVWPWSTWSSTGKKDRTRPRHLIPEAVLASGKEMEVITVPRSLEDRVPCRVRRLGKKRW